jgi:hypothetical protein
VENHHYENIVQCLPNNRNVGFLEVDKQLKHCPVLISYFLQYLREQGVEENIWTKEGWSDGRVEKAV